MTASATTWSTTGRSPPRKRNRRAGTRCGRAARAGPEPPRRARRRGPPSRCGPSPPPRQRRRRHYEAVHRPPERDGGLPAPETRRGPSTPRDPSMGPSVAPWVTARTMAPPPGPAHNHHRDGMRPVAYPRTRVREVARGPPRPAGVAPGGPPAGRAGRGGLARGRRRLAAGPAPPEYRTYPAARHQPSCSSGWSSTTSPRSATPSGAPRAPPGGTSRTGCPRRPRPASSTSWSARTCGCGAWPGPSTCSTRRSTGRGSSRL